MAHLDDLGFMVEGCKTSTPICAIGLPHANPLTLHTILSNCNHNNKCTIIKFSLHLMYGGRSKVTSFYDLVMTQGELHG